MSNAIALPRAKRRRPFGPREKRALAWLCFAVFVICVNFAWVVDDMAKSHVDFWTVFDVIAIAFWGRVIIPAEWKTIRAWLDSDGDA